ncbi:hypothetical protein [Streptomyces mirabilis]|uniref:hypothetical protein n=1 Tax=Streptomyces mirabilis TaxID=68239 RepID=UPI0036BBBD76
MQRKLMGCDVESLCCFGRQLGMVSPVWRGQQAAENDGFGVGGQLDPGVGGTVGITERVLAQHVEAAVPALPKRLTAAPAGEPPGQVIAGGDVGQRGGGMCASVDDPVVPEIGSQDLGQPCQVMLFIAEEPAAVTVTDAFIKTQDTTVSRSASQTTAETAPPSSQS